VQQEIAQLESKKGERNSALLKSKKELNDDETALQTFIANDEKERKTKSDVKKKAQKMLQNKEDALKARESEI